MAKDSQSGFLKDSSVVPSVNLSIPMPVDALPSSDVLDVFVEYDEVNDEVTVYPDRLQKDATIRFRNSKGAKLRIEFLSPTGEGTSTVADSEYCMLRIGGTYHFKAYFTFPGTDQEISPKYGGVIDVEPQRP